MNKIIERGNWRSENKNEVVWCRAAVLYRDVRAGAILSGSWRLDQWFSLTQDAHVQEKGYEGPIWNRKNKTNFSSRFFHTLGLYLIIAGIRVPPTGFRPYWKLGLEPGKIDEGFLPFSLLQVWQCDCTVECKRVGSTQERKNISDITVL